MEATTRALVIQSAGSTLYGARAAASLHPGAAGVRVDIRTDHGHLLHRRMIEGRLDADIVMLPCDMIDDLIARGWLDAERRVALGAVAIGAAVREGRQKPKLDDMGDLAEALMAADEIGLTMAPSGEHMVAIIENLGLKGALAPRLRRFDKSADVHAWLAASDGGALAFGPASEILAWRDRGVVWAGPLPAPAQSAVSYSAALCASSRDNEAAARFLAFLDSAQARAAFAASGVA